MITVIITTLDVAQLTYLLLTLRNAPRKKMLTQQNHMNNCSFQWKQHSDVQQMENFSYFKCIVDRCLPQIHAYILMYIYKRMYLQCWKIKEKKFAEYFKSCLVYPVPDDASIK